MADISKITLPSGATYDIKDKYANIAYGTCTTTAATAEKVIAIVDNPNWNLQAGSIVVVKFSYTNTAQNPTLNVNDTGAKSIWYGTELVTTSSLTTAGYANRYTKYFYDGTQFVWLGHSIDNNSTYSNASLGQIYGTCTTDEVTTAKTVAMPSYALTIGGIVAIKFTNDVPAESTLNINSNGAKSIYYKGSAITDGIINAGDTATFIYSDQYHLIAIDRDAYTHPTYTAKSSGLYKVTVDSTGHVSSVEDVVKSDITALGIPASDTNTHYTSKNVVNSSSTSTSNTTTALTNGNVYLISVENGAVTSAHKITGSGATTVTTDASGNIVISSTDTNTVYTHPTTSGNKHIPSGGSSGQILRWSADGTAAWGADNNTTYSNFVKSGSGAKAGLVPAPSTTAGTTKYLREDGTWSVPPDTNTTYSAATTSANGLMTSTMVTKLNGITDSADSVSFSRSLTSGTKVGTITINGTGTDLYAPTNTDTHYTTGLKVGASSTATANAAATNGNVYLNALDNTTVRDSHKITGSGATTVTSDANGVITISSTNTTYSSLKNPYALTIQGNGTTLTNGTYDGSAAKTVNITPSSIGAAVSSHTHSYAGSSSAGGVATSANKLATARTINDVSFDGTANIVIPRSTKHIHVAAGTEASSGYVKIATIKVTGTYANHPVEFVISQRGRGPYHLYVQFYSTNTTDPALYEFKYFDPTDKGVNAYIVKSATSTWDIYIGKSEGYDHIYILDVLKADGNEGIQYAITYTNVHASSLPTDYQVATLAKINGYTLADACAKGIINNTSVSPIGWVSNTESATVIPTINTIAYWNGAHTVGSTASNLAYCNKGAFGTAATKGVDTTATSGSSNLITSGAMYTALAGKAASSHTHNYAGSSSAGGAANSLSYFQNTSNTNMGQDTCNSNAIGYINDYSGTAITANAKDGALYRQVYSTSWVHEIYGDYRTGSIAVRGKNNGTWQSWKRVLDESNYTSYTVTKTGSGASGSWEISVTGSSASCTGNAATATALTTSAGSATQPVYFSNGKPVATTYTLGKSVPSSAVFTDTNTYVTQTNTTASASYRLLMSYNANDTTQTVGARKSANFTANPSTGCLTASMFKGTYTTVYSGTISASSGTITISTLWNYSLLFLSIYNIDATLAQVDRYPIAVQKLYANTPEVIYIFTASGSLSTSKFLTFKKSSTANSIDITTSGISKIGQITIEAFL